MKRTNTPTKKKKPKKPGPKTACTDEVIEQAYRLCLLGLTNRELGIALNKHRDTIGYWYRNYPKFKEAVDKGRVHADANVADALYQRALGYSHEAVKFFKMTVTEKEYDDNGNVKSERSYNKIVPQPYVKHYPPDTKAATKWLGVRNRDTWGESNKVLHEHRHQHLMAANINIHHVLDQIGDPHTFSNEELEALAKLGLNKVADQITEGQEV